MGKRYGEKLDLATSQNVVVELPLAGLGTRILANIIDTLIIYFAMIFIFIVANISNLFKYVEALPEWVIAILIILLFVLSWGYFPLWEFYGNGKTPGKRALKIRVRMDNGSPLTFSATLTRNLMRVADYLPYMYAIGVLTIIFNKKNKRLGDMVAGTVVIADQKFDLKRYMAEESNGIEAPTFKISGLSGIKLSHHTYETLDSFFQRKEKLPPEVRIRIVDNMLSGLALKNLPEGLPLKEKEAILYKIFTEGN